MTSVVGVRQRKRFKEYQKEWRFYDKEKHRNYMKKHRKYKYTLMNNGLLENAVKRAGGKN